MKCKKLNDYKKEIYKKSYNDINKLFSQLKFKELKDLIKTIDNNANCEDGSFLWALCCCESGKCVRRISWYEDFYIYNGKIWFGNIYDYKLICTIEDMLANDWYICEKIEPINHEFFPLLKMILKNLRNTKKKETQHDKARIPDLQINDIFKYYISKYISSIYNIDYNNALKIIVKNDKIENGEFNINIYALKNIIKDNNIDLGDIANKLNINKPNWIVKIQCTGIYINFFIDRKIYTSLVINNNIDLFETFEVNRGGLFIEGECTLLLNGEKYPFWFRSFRNLRQQINEEYYKFKILRVRII